MVDYYNVTTNTGDAEIAAAIASNTKLAITHIAFGDGNGAVPTPLKTRTTLVREVHRQAVTKYERHSTNANWIVIETIIPSNIGGFWVREMGVIANGKMISHGSHAPFEKVADPTGVSEYRLKFTLNVKDGNVVNITLDQSLIYASQAWTDENYVPRDEIIDNLTTDDALKPVSAKQAKNLQDNKLNKDANAVSATKLETSRTFSFSGAATGSFNFDGSSNSSAVLTLANSGVAANTYGGNLKIPVVTVNAKGLITGVSEKEITKASLGLDKFGQNPNLNTAVGAPNADAAIIITDTGWGVYRNSNLVNFDQALPIPFGGTGRTDGKAQALVNPRKINGVDFDGSQPIDIEAPLRLLGQLTTLEQVNSAVYDGKYTVSEVPIAGIYGYGFLVVLRSGGVCHQIYYPHLSVGVVNGSTMAMRQSWNMNGNVASWSEWRVLGTRDDSKLPLSGGTLTGELGTPSVRTSNFFNEVDYNFYGADSSTAQRIKCGGLLASHTWYDAQYIPVNGFFSRGDIWTAGVSRATLFHAETANLQVVNGTDYTIVYDYATRLVHIQMRVFTNQPIYQGLPHSGSSTSLNLRDVTLPITLRKRLHTQAFFTTVNAAGVGQMGEAYEWMWWTPPPGIDGATDSKVRISAKRWTGTTDEPCHCDLFVTGYF